MRKISFFHHHQLKEIYPVLGDCINIYGYLTCTSELHQVIWIPFSSKCSVLLLHIALRSPQTPQIFHKNRHVEIIIRSHL